jgi:uncharacterized protein
MTYLIAKYIRLVAVMLPAFSITLSQAQDQADAISIIQKHRKEQEATFRNKQLTPLTKKDLRKFKHLNFYEIDLNFRVRATFIKNDKPLFFKMKTTTDRLPSYSKYGELHFELEGRQFSLAVYQSPDIMKRPGYEDYLFIPFTDKTNGDETYEVGRYLEFRIPTTEEVILDFNLCYNPYCSYNDGYSCPIPPEENSIPIRITAGEKKYRVKH